MPGFNGTDHAGMGPRTGGGRGFCAPGAGGFSGTEGGRGAGRGLQPCGGGRGRGRQWTGTAGYRAAAANRDNMLKLLKHQAEALENELAALHKKIDALGGQQKA